MDAQGWAITLSIGVVWALVGVYLAILLRRRPAVQGNSRQSLWLFWLCFIFFAIAVTSYHPALRPATRGLRYWLIIATYVAQGYVCYNLAPSLRPRRDWLLLAAGLSILSQLGLEWLGAAYQITSLPIHVAMLIIVACVVLPAYTQARRQEHKLPLRLRFLALAGFHVAIGIWMCKEVVECALLLAHISYSVAYIEIVLGIVCVTTFPAYFLPERVFMWLALGVQRLDDWLTFYLVRVVERTARRAAQRDPLAVDLRAILRSPALCTYSSAIAIMDMRKPLGKQAAAPRWLVEQLEQVARPEMDYAEIIRRLRAMGWRLLLLARGWPAA